MNNNIAILIWNSFQFIHFKNIALNFSSINIITTKLDYIDNDISNNIEVWKEKEFYILDKYFDIVIAQSQFAYMYDLKCKIIFLQYSYAKESHQFAPWHSMADVCLVYGQYAYDSLSSYAPCRIVGNPRNIINKIKNKYIKFKSNTKKNILYVPTWGKYSTLNMYYHEIKNLSKEYNLLIKIHHNSEYFNEKSLTLLNDIHYFNSNDDIIELIQISDIVISDYSGAIFDAIYYNKFLVLLNLPNKYLYESGLHDKFSIEFKEREKLGIIVNEPAELAYNIKKVFYSKIAINKLFDKDIDILRELELVFQELSNGNIQKNKQQQYLENFTRDMYKKTKAREKLMKILNLGIKLLKKGKK